jgi:predicted nucleic acid-binding protein
MYYLDSNKVIYAAGDSGEKGEWCRSVINKIENREITACTSYITYDEFFYKIRKEFGHSEALMLSKSFLETPNLTFFPLTK